MATVGNTNLTMFDVIKMKDPDGRIAKIVPLLSKKMPHLRDIPMEEGNLTTGHRVVQDTALPVPTARRLNQGVDPTKGTSDVVEETCGLYTGLSKVDRQILALSGDPAGVRLQRDLKWAEGFNQKIASDLFFSDVTANPEQFQGFKPRLDATSGNPFSAQIIKADGSASGSDQTSIWLIGWGADKVFGIYPKGTVAGLEMNDMGQQLARDANNKEFVAMVTEWTWKPGLAVADGRFVSRVCNIDTSAWKADLSAGADIALAMQDAMTAIYDLDQCTPVFYMHRQTYGMLAKQLVKRQANWLEMVTKPDGTRVQAFMGIPIKITDSLTITEAVVS